MKMTTSKLGEPFNRFQDSDSIRTIQYRDREHTPDNQRPGRVESLLTMDVQRSEVGNWVAIQLQEITTHRSGQVKGRTITATISLEEAKRIAKFINEGK